MAEIDPEVQRLLDSLLTSGLADLGRLATARILEGEDPGEDDDGRGAPRPPLHPRRQLELADKAVSQVLGLELALGEQTTRLFGEFREHQSITAFRAYETGARPVMLERIVVLGGTAEAADGTHGDDPLSARRPQALGRLLAAWRKGVEEIEERLEPWN